MAMPHAERALSKIEKLVVETRAHLAGLVIETSGKSPAEVLDMARAERNKPGKLVRWVPHDTSS